MKIVRSEIVGVMGMISYVKDEYTIPFLSRQVVRNLWDEVE